MASVFISYRRSDTTAGYASWIYERLAAVLGSERVFMDLDSLPLGIDFVDHLEHALSAANVALVLIGPHWLDAVDEKGARRLDDPNDLVRIEIAAALRASVRVIPVLIDGATVPDAAQLPLEIAQLARRHALVFQRQGGAAIRDIVATVQDVAGERTPARRECQPPRSRSATGGALVAWRPTFGATIAAAALITTIVLAAAIALTSGKDPNRVGDRGIALVTGPMSAVVPPGWRTSQRGSDYGLGLTARATVVPAIGTAKGRIMIGLGPRSSHNADMIATRFTRRLSGSLRGRRTRVRLGGALQAGRYEQLRPRGTSASLTIYVSPTSAGVATVACVRPASAATCLQVARTLSVANATPFAIGPSAAYATAVNTSVRMLARALSRTSFGLRSATTAAGQARAADVIAQACVESKAPLRSLRLSPADVEGNTRLMLAFTQTRVAYASLARAARAEDAARYGRAARSVKRGHAAVASALRGLEGYRALVTESLPAWRGIPSLEVAKAGETTPRADGSPPPAPVTPPPAAFAPPPPPPPAKAPAVFIK